MKKFYFLLSICLALTNYLIAQNNTGHHTDNYAGVYSLDFNPAEIVDNRYKFHMNLLYSNFTFSNNYVGLRRDAIFSDRDFAFEDDDFQENYMVERLNGRNKKVFLNSNFTLPLSFMANFGKKNKNAIGFTLKTRFYTNVNGVSEELARQSFEGLDIDELLNVGIQNKNFSLQAAAWNEIGFSYGREVFDLGNHYLKAAGTFKITQGIASAYFYSDNLDVTFPTDSTISVTNSDVRFGYSELFSSTIGQPTITAQDLNIKPGLGFDVGVTYEWRPNIEDYKYELDGDPDYLDPRKNKYKLKLGVGLIDMGYVKFQRNELILDDIVANRSDIDIDQTFGPAFDDFGNTGLQGFSDTLASIFTATKSDNETYRMSLPMRINAYADYHIWKGFYANATASIAPAFKKNAEKTRGISEFSLTPRFEHKWIGFYLPFSANTHGNLHMGTGLRLGPLVMGTNDILVLAKKKIHDANFYASLSIPIAKKIRDKDKDHVSNQKDNCRKDPGPWATNGCPDRDLDGITDDIDKCPDVPGVEKFEGCPDTDNDGIRDSEDDCPEIAGIEAFNGCPDTDEDGIEDSKDDCPEVAGVAAFNGCPDRDGDGVQDSEDDCPDRKGTVEFNGCPDSDGDGLGDLDDNCPDKAGPKSNKGCPLDVIDTDGDGVEDKVDKCPKTPGTIANNGCPEIKEEDKEIIDIAFQNLEFESGNSKIKSSSYESLQNLSKIMKDNKEYRLRIAGHTDSVGSESGNLKLSKQRAEAVKTYLTQYGIAGNRFIVESYGETKPIASNETAAGRQQNRRVEMEIVFD